MCEPDWIRTNDPQLRRLMLYPAELPVRLLLFFFEIANVADFFKKPSGKFRPEKLPLSIPSQ